MLSIGALIVATFWVLRPFLTPAIWAAMIVVSPWPMLRWFEAPLMQQQLAYARSGQFDSPPRLSPRAREGRRVRYIERFYNPRRRHSTLGYLSPVDYEKSTSAG